MSYLGTWEIDDALYFYCNTTRFDTGAATDADAEPTYRVYENETGTALLNGTLSLIDAGNTAGFYSETITLSTANGFEVGKQYAIYISATVNSVAGASHHTFQVEAKSIKKNAALAKFMFLMTDSTNHNPATGLTVSVTRSVDGAAFGAGTLSAVTEVSSGMYYVDFAAGDLNGNVITLRATATGADDAFITIVTTP